jgi:hypothetical protein
LSAANAAAVFSISSLNGIDISSSTTQGVHMPEI